MIYKMICELGRQDIPIIQKQPPFRVDLLDTNIVIFGTNMSGKTSFLKLLITILHKRYREDKEQIFILDFGGAMADFSSLPLVSAYFDNANEEYVKRVFKLMEDQLKDNNDKLEGKNFRDCAANQRPIHTTLCIDNVNAFLDEPRYTAYQEKLAKLCRDGLSKGITIILTAGSTKGMSGYLPNFKQKIALEMPADSYSDIFNHKVIPVGSNPGHGYANVTIPPDNVNGTFPIQLPYELQLNYPDDIHSEVFRKNLEKAFQTRTVQKYKRFPNVLTKEEYEKFIENAHKKEDEEPLSELAVSVGLDYTECRQTFVDFGYSRVCAIYGKKGGGKTNLLRRILQELDKKQEWNYVFLDDGREQLRQFCEKRKAEYIFSFDQKEMIVAKEMEEVIGGKKVKTLNHQKEKVKLSPMQQFMVYLHTNYIDMSGLRRQGNSVMSELFGKGIRPEEFTGTENKNTIFVLQSKFLYINSLPSLIFMTVILPILTARAEEMNWIFLFTDVKNISESDMRENFHSTIGTAFLLDNIAEFVSERGSKSVFGSMDVKALKEEYARCGEGDGYLYSIEKDLLKKLKFVFVPEKNNQKEE